ncbi:uncharacterized protein LOC130725065 [Lotus japonicus]|uniref:uncharacterized protein LOC130725065 n=1 Tax=Lotus japonicus TaxID=34305 RepID=UPI002582B876|nr:uncharacterized protein LOC130725065 [Lotus japonicus]
MKCNGEDLTEQLVVEKVLRTLTPKFDMIVVSIEETKVLSHLKLEVLQGTLEARELKVTERYSEHEAERVLLTQGKKISFDDRKKKWKKGDKVSDVWYMDTRCSNHMTGQREWLIDFDASKKTTVKLTNNSSMLAEGLGNISLQRKDGKTAFIEDVLVVP